MTVIREAQANGKGGVTKLPRSNIFEAGAASVAELFEDYLEDAPANGMCIVLVLGSRFGSASTASRNAIEKSLAALGCGNNACTYAAIAPGEGPDGGGDAPELDPQALFLLVEGLDPLCVIATDGEAVNALGRAYRTTFDVDSAIRVFGRPSVAFANLEELLATDAGKQRAWHLFKSLPKR